MKRKKKTGPKKCYARDCAREIKKAEAKIHQAIVKLAREKKYRLLDVFIRSAGELEDVASHLSNFGKER